MNFEERYFNRFNFDKSQTKKHLANALKDIQIAKTDKILDVKFTYAYSALLKTGIALLSHHQIKAKSIPGHHVKIIEKLAEILNDDSINDIGNAMRLKRNIGMYSGGIEITEKECCEFIDFVSNVISKVKIIIYSH
ncbi:MAG: Uncharacterized protein FD145_384 [Candidatus Saganbacteria bacterium]|uniref:HEPN domain-containing protein n=1 Tax=Candidatus Saganbacteria bacterium TaxID=2575572 RepID=A0A833L1W7_UNCSA|nr:MAG: Uncharacterized protein FD145_384 [Candidatus Saganbacteria bacterium]